MLPTLYVSALLLSTCCIIAIVLFHMSFAINTDIVVERFDAHLFTSTGGLLKSFGTGVKRPSDPPPDAHENDCRVVVFTDDVPLFVPSELVASTTLLPVFKTQGLPPVLAQGVTLSSSAHAVANALRYDMTRRAASPTFVPSRNFMFFNAFSSPSTPSCPTSHKCASIGYLLKGVGKHGVCQEALDPFDPTALEPTQPSPAAKTDAKKKEHYFNSCAFSRVQGTTQNFKRAILQYGVVMLELRVVCGWQLGGAGSFSVPPTGSSCLKSPTSDPLVLPAPRGGSYSVVGAHAVLLVGWDDAASAFKLQDSVGENWGHRGYGTISFDYVDKFGADAFVVTKSAGAP